jgi:hypothetical protein
LQLINSKELKELDPEKQLSVKQRIYMKATAAVASLGEV